MQRSKTLFNAAALSVALLTAPAMAHTDAVLASMAAPNGGQLRVAGPYHFEFVADAHADGKQAAPVKVFVTDHAGNPSDVTGVTGTLTLLGTGGRATAGLTPAGKGLLTASAIYVADRKLKAIVALTFPGGSVEQARFVPVDPE